MKGPGPFLELLTRCSGTLHTAAEQSDLTPDAEPGKAEGSFILLRQTFPSLLDPKAAKKNSELWKQQLLYNPGQEKSVQAGAPA
jgi:hypothetical protein